MSLPVFRAEHYDARKAGALCDSCPLGGRRRELGAGGDWIPVPSEMKPSAQFFVLGEAPGGEEEKDGIPFVGASGTEVMRTFQLFSVQRPQYALGNVIACVEGTTSVYLADGRKVPIQNLVRDRYVGEVLSFDETTGQVVRRRVTGHYRTPLAGRKLFRLVTRWGRKGSQAGQAAGPVLTQDHKVLTEVRGWQALESLASSDRVATGDVRGVGATEAVVVGSLLGDAGLGNSNASFVISQVSANADYVRLKAGLLAPFQPRVSTHHAPSLVRNGSAPQTLVRLLASRWMRELRDTWYPQGTKVVPPTLTALSPLAIAVWFLDDGYMRLRPGRMPRAEFATCGFTRGDNERLAALLAVWGIHARLSWHKNWKGKHLQKKGYWRLLLDPISTERLAALIAPYVPDSMQHKLPEFHRGRFDARLWVVPETVPYYDEFELQPFVHVGDRGQRWKGEKARWRRRPWGERPVYCLDVEGTHNFITATGVVVHNCRPPANELKRLLFKVRAYNKAHEEEDDFVPMPTPMAACRPRLLRELRQFDNLVLIGGTAMRAMLGEQVAVDDYRGAPLRVVELLNGELMLLTDENTPPARHTWKVLGTYHAAHVLRSKRLRPVFAVDLGRSLRHFANALNWRPPHIVRQPSIADLRKFLYSGLPFYLLDIESEYHPSPGSTKKNRCRLVGRCSDGCVMQSPLEQRCQLIGIGNADVAYVIRLLSVDGVTEHYDAPGERAALWQLLREWWTDPTILKAGHNLGYYDTLSLARPEHIGAEPVNYLDTIMLSRLEDSELPKDLGFRVMLRTDAPPWKASGERDAPKSNHSQEEYNAYDVANNAAIVPSIFQNVAARNQNHLIYYDHLKQLMARNLHRMGMRVDQAQREKLEAQLEKDQREWTVRFHTAIGRTDVSPTSAHQVRQLLYYDWGLIDCLDEKKHFSESTGEPSTGDDVLVMLYVHPDVAVNPQWRDAIRALRHVRKAQKMKSVAETCRPRSMRLLDGSHAGGWTWPDGRLRVNWSAHSPNSGRIASSDPMNFQNISGAPYNMRSMFVPDPGHCFVSCDLDQIELRIAVALSQAKNYIDAFSKGQDPHGLMCERAFGERYTKASGYVDPRTGDKPKKGTVCARLRDLIKRVTYGSLYLATVATVHKQIVSAEDERGDLIDADREVPETRLTYERWLEFAPEIKTQYWDRTIAFWKRHGYVVEPVLGRRRDCADSDSRGARDDDELEVNEIVNSVVQPAAASLMALMLAKILTKYPWGFGGPNTGICLETHDSYMLEVPVDRAVEVRDDLQAIMTMDHPALPNVRITSEADISMRYGNLFCAYCGGDTDKEMSRWLTNKPGKIKVCICDEPQVAA